MLRLFPDMGSADVLLVFAERPRFARGGRRSSRTGAAAADLLFEHTLEIARETGVAILLAGELAGQRGFAVGRGGMLAARGRGFGARMRNAVEDAFALGYRRVVVVGCDIPGLTVARIRQAFALLASDRGSVVVGPARDGGYYLLGLTRFDGAIFRDIPWHTGRVLARTLRALRGRRVVLLPTLSDADDLEALHRALREAAPRAALRLVRELLAPAWLDQPWAPPPVRSVARALVPLRRGPPERAAAA
jgi:hypothetical protein